MLSRKMIRLSHISGVILVVSAVLDLTVLFMSPKAMAEESTVRMNDEKQYVCIQLLYQSTSA